MSKRKPSKQAPQESREFGFAGDIGTADTYEIKTYRPDLGMGIATVSKATGKVVKFRPLSGEEVKHGE